jgi:hypothetical protein
VIYERFMPNKVFEFTNLTSIIIDAKVCFSSIVKLPNLVSVSVRILINDLPDHIFENIKELGVEDYQLILNKNFCNLESLSTNTFSNTDCVYVTLPPNLRVLTYNNWISTTSPALDKLCFELLKNLSVTHCEKLTHLTYLISGTTQFLPKFKNLKYLRVEAGTIEWEHFCKVSVSRFELTYGVKFSGDLTCQPNHIQYMMITSPEFLWAVCLIKPKVLKCIGSVDAVSAELLTSVETLIADFGYIKQTLNFLQSFSDCHRELLKQFSPRVFDRHRKLYEKLPPKSNVKCCKYLEITEPRYIPNPDEYQTRVQNFQEYVSNSLMSVRFVRN